MTWVPTQEFSALGRRVEGLAEIDWSHLFFGLGFRLQRPLHLTVSVGPASISVYFRSRASVAWAEQERDRVIARSEAVHAARAARKAS